LDFAPYLTEGAVMVLSEKTKAIVSFALCGFANLSSIAILLGGLGSLAPSRRADIARFGLQAVLAATLSNLMSATIAGLFLSL
jgi:concentrative nucleoside transporter, CNT family